MSEILSNMYIGLHVSIRYACQTVMKLEFSGHISEKNTEISNSMKIRPVGPETFHAKGQTDRETELEKDRYNEANSLFSQ
jgi:hypothetical protein